MRKIREAVGSASASVLYLNLIQLFVLSDCMRDNPENEQSLET